MPGFFTVAWWAAKLALARGSATTARATVAPWFTPWVVVPVVTIAGVVFAVVQINSAYKRGYELGDQAGYARKAKEVADATAAANHRIGDTNTASAGELAAKAAERAKLVADVKQMAAELETAKAASTSQATAIRALNLENETLRRSKTRTIEKPVVKVKRVIERVEAPCAVGETITGKLNAIQ